jgi:hypothetical protein
VRDRPQPAVVSETETGVVAVRVTGVGDVDEIAVDGDADRLAASRGDDTVPHERRAPVTVDAQHRDLIAAGVDGDQEPAVAGQLDGALRGQPRAVARAAGRER